MVFPKGLVLDRLMVEEQHGHIEIRAYQIGCNDGSYSRSFLSDSCIGERSPMTNWVALAVPHGVILLSVFETP